LAKTTFKHEIILSHLENRKGVNMSNEGLMQYVNTYLSRDCENA